MKKLLGIPELIRYGFYSMSNAFYYRMNYKDNIDRLDFFTEINIGWMEMYIWDYDDWYNPYPSPERRLRLGAK